MFSPSFPAATTSSAFFDCAKSTASWRALDLPLVPKEQLITFSPAFTAYSIPAIASEVEPLPREFMNFTGTSPADQQIPELPFALLPRPGHDPRHVRAVPVVVLARALPLDRVPPVGVVDVAVLVVVLAVVRLVRAPEHVRREVRVVGVDARVEDPDLRAAGPRAPGLRRVDVVVLGRLDDGVVERVEGVVGGLGRRGGLDEVGLGVGHAVHAAQAPAQQVRGPARARTYYGQPAAAHGGEAPRGAPVHRGEDPLLALARDAVLEPHEELPGHGRRGGAGGRREHEQDGGGERDP